ncbi:LLM class flavin-dependent oxidoreductase [Kribbella sp. NBC_00709]|uniref:LLM class flavin-dependent oxidoreductase n=1 Tax=Kribbella sp. NBC_00709 TaxID=2975972 RepID=UPI002E2AC1BB|nr:LLM class flavin-dependent oxidoreductase [Kribbella sp. NBC_00709]
MRLGFKLIAEAYGPSDIVEQAVRAEEAGFDFVEVSDHFHPWVSEHEHSGFAFSMLAAMAMRTSSIGLATGVTCPFIRYHPNRGDGWRLNAGRRAGVEIPAMMRSVVM